MLEIAYLIASVTFILGLKMLSNPASARKGNLIAALGMVVGIIATIFLYRSENGAPLDNLIFIFGAIALGTVVGTLMAKKVKMTAMPQMVSLFNGMGGACAALISIIEYWHCSQSGTFPALKLAIILAGLIIGTVSFAGSIIAWGKLEDKIKDRCLPRQQVINMGLLLLVIGMVIYVATGGLAGWGIYLVLCLCMLYGILFVLPIGGADMPVVISLLNSFTGVAAAMGGFLYSNQAMLTGGILVGSAGTILTVLMCKAMNRSLVNVLIGAIGGGSAGTAGGGPQGDIREISSSDLAVMLAYAKKLRIVPGYGLAVAQAQHTVHDLEKMLVSNGVEVKYSIHPVAGRMPGHMNVLLAEADVSYDNLEEMEDANPAFYTTDVVLVIGANDVVNPAARTDRSSPIFGMPILDVDKAHNVVVLKRSMGRGYAGIENALFFDKKTRMYFGDAKDSLGRLLAELKQL